MKEPIENPSFPPPERAQHDEIVHTKDATTGREFFQLKSATQIDKYWARGSLGKTEESVILRDIGNEYGRLVYAGCLGPRYASVNMLRVVSVANDGTHQQEAQDTIRRTDKELGPTHASIMRAVCAEDWTATAWARNRAQQHGWAPPKAHFGMMLLLDALRMTRKIWKR